MTTDHSANEFHLNQQLNTNRYNGFQMARMKTKPFRCNGYKKRGVAQPWLV